MTMGRHAVVKVALSVVTGKRREITALGHLMNLAKSYAALMIMKSHLAATKGKLLLKYYCYTDVSGKRAEVRLLYQLKSTQLI